MRASFDFGSGAGGTTAGQLPFRILVMGPFAGDGGARPGAQAPAAAGATRPARVEAEGFDALVERVLGPLTLKDLTWPGAGSPTALTLRFTALKSFRPEALASQLPGGADALAAREFLLQLKARRLNRADTRAKLRELGLPGDLAASVDAALSGAAVAGATAPDAAAPAAPPAPASAPPPAATGSLEGLFSLVDDDDASGASAATPAPREAPADPAVSALSGLISAIAGGGTPGTASDAGAATAALQALDAWLGARLNLVLAHPEFRARESAWRGLRYLLQKGTARAGVVIDILDAPDDDARLNDVLDALAAAAEVEPGGRTPYSLLASLAHWHLDEAGIANLAAVAARAAALQLPVVASAGLEALIDLNDELAEPWQEFGRKPEAGWLALAVNPFLVRGRYAPEAEAVKGFDFTESLDEFEGDDGPWAAPALGVAAAAAQSFARDGWPTRFEGADGGTLENLPVRPVEQGGRTAQSSGQAVLPDKIAGLLGQSGFIALVPALDRDEVVIFRAPSLRSPLATSGGAADAAARLETSLPFALAVSRLASLLTVAIQKLPGSSVSAEDVVAGLDRILSAQGIGAVNAHDARVALQPAATRPGGTDVLVRWRPGPPVLPAGAVIELSLPFPN